MKTEALNLSSWQYKYIQDMYSRLRQEGILSSAIAPESFTQNFEYRFYRSPTGIWLPMAATANHLYTEGKQSQKSICLPLPKGIFLSGIGRIAFVPAPQEPTEHLLHYPVWEIIEIRSGSIDLSDATDLDDTSERQYIQVPSITIETSLPKIWPQRDCDLQETMILPPPTYIQELLYYKLTSKGATHTIGEFFHGVDARTNDQVMILAVRSRHCRELLEEMAGTGALSHRHILSPHHLFIEQNTLFIVMRYLPALPLRIYLREYAPSLRRRLLLILAIVRAISYAHKQGMVHGSLNPSNILVTSRGHPYVINFGIERLNKILSMTRKYAPDILRYMSPEQVKTRNFRAPLDSDIYSLGTLMYEIVSGKTAVKRGSVVEMKNSIREVQSSFLRQVNAEIPLEIEAICGKAMAKEQRRRYQNAAEMARDINHYLDAQPVDIRLLTPRFFMRKWYLQSNKALRVAIPLLLFFSCLIALEKFNFFYNRKGGIKDSITFHSEMPRLRKEIWAEHRHVRKKAIRELARSNGPKREIIPVLLGVLHTEDQETRREAIYALKKVDPNSDIVIPELRRLLSSSHLQLREGVLETLESYGTKASSAKPELLNALDDPFWSARIKAIEVLGKILDDEVEKAIVKRLDDDHWAVRHSTIRILSKVEGNPYFITILDVAARDSNKAVRIRALAICAKASSDNVDAIPKLVGMLSHSDPMVRESVLLALGKIRPIPLHMLPFLVEKIKGRSWLAKKYAREALMEIDWRQVSIVERFSRLLRKEPLVVRQAVVSALLQTSNLPPAMVDPLIIALQDQDGFVRQKAAIALGKLGRKARKAVPYLQAALHDESLWVQKAAEAALEKIK